MALPKTNLTSSYLFNLNQTCSRWLENKKIYFHVYEVAPFAAVRGRGEGK